MKVRIIVDSTADMAPRYRGRAAVAPLPDPSVTTPNFYIKNCAAAQPSGSTSCVVANEAEVK